MLPAEFAAFDTALGWCGIAWTERQNVDSPLAITHFQLPEATAEMTESRIARLSGGTKSANLPKQIVQIRRRIVRHLSGDLQDFRDIPVDLSATGPFVQRVCELTREIPSGKTVTYADIAKSIGRPSLARAVGRALGRNPIPLIIPCHRVMAAHGKPGGFSAYGGRTTKAKLLALEGATVNLCLELELGPETNN